MENTYYVHTAAAYAFMHFGVSVAYLKHINSLTLFIYLKFLRIIIIIKYYFPFVVSAQVLRSPT